MTTLDGKQQVGMDADEHTDQAVFHALPASSFPFTIAFIAGDGTVVHTIEVPAPGTAITVAPLVSQFGLCRVRLSFADGSVVEYP